MADFGQLLDPAAMASAAQPNVDELRGRWDQYLNDPKTQGALLSFAGQAAQPRQWGQSNFGALMSSLGQGGASVRATEELDRKQMEAESKTDLREAQAYGAESRANTAAANAGRATDRLGFERERETGRNDRSMLARQLQARTAWGREVANVQKLNEGRSLMRQPLLPLPLLDKFLLDAGLPTTSAPPTGTTSGDPNEAPITVPPRPGATPPGTVPSTGGQTPRPGQVVNGFRFRGGNPRDRNNWERAQ